WKVHEGQLLHVSADHPQARQRAVEIAIEFRQKFDKDVFIDLVCFRRQGHNEADEPMITQPLMYKSIREHPGTRPLYAQRLVADGVVKADEAEGMIAAYRTAMDKGLHTNTTVISTYKPPF